MLSYEYGIVQGLDMVLTRINNMPQPSHKDAVVNGRFTKAYDQETETGSICRGVQFDEPIVDTCYDKVKVVVIKDE